MRAVLFARATATTRLGRRRRSPITQGSALVAFERSRLALAPLISRRRKYRLPRFEMPPRRALPPVECCRGTRPSHAANSRALANPLGSTTIAAIAVAMIGPMPGIVAKRWLSGLLRCQAVSSFSTFATAACASSTCVASTRRTGRARSGKRRSLASRTIAISWLTLRSPAGATTPNSARCARSAFTSVVRCRTSLSLPRCRRTAACCSAVLIGTNRIVGRRTASQIASASAASVLLRLTYAFTLRRHQPDLVAGCLQLPRPVVRRRAGFESNQTTRQFGKEGDDLTPPKPFAQNAFPGRIDAVDLKNVFRQIQPYRLNLAHGWLPSMVRFTDHHSGTDMPQRGPSTPSLDQLVGAGEQRPRHFQPECPRRLQIDDKLEPRRLIKRYVARLRAVQDLSDIAGHT